MPFHREEVYVTNVGYEMFTLFTELVKFKFGSREDAACLSYLSLWLESGFMLSLLNLGFCRFLWVLCFGERGESMLLWAKDAATVAVL